MHTPTIQNFFEFIYKRQLIWHKRFILKQPAPRTDDYVLRTFKIINVYRELDKCTIYFIDKMKGISDRKSLLLNSIFFRFFNLVNIYERLRIQGTGNSWQISEKNVIASESVAIAESYIDLKQQVNRHEWKFKVQNVGNRSDIITSPIDWLSEMAAKDRFKSLWKKLSELKDNGEKIFNNAYIISSGWGKHKHIEVLESLYSVYQNIDYFIDKIDNAKTPRESLNVLTEIFLVGDFLACEIWTDLSYFGFFRQWWSDDSFVNLGPWAKRGLELLYGDLKTNALYEKLQLLYEIQKSILPTIHLNLKEELTWSEIAYKGAYSNYPFLSITNIEWSLCEFRKYTNISNWVWRRKYYKS